MLSAEPKAEAGNTYRNRQLLRKLQNPNLIIVLLYINFFEENNDKHTVAYTRSQKRKHWGRD